MEQFPKTLEAFRQHKDAEGKVEGALWLIGEALIEECGPPGPDGVNNGSGSKIEAARKFLKQEGMEDEADRAVRDCRKNIAEACESFSKAQTHVPAFPPLTDQNRDDLIAVAQSAIQKGTELKEMIARLGLPELREEREAA
jgi:hypothetical protein